MNRFVEYMVSLLQQGLFCAIPAILICAVVLFSMAVCARKRNRPFSWKKAVGVLLLIGWAVVTIFATLMRQEFGYRRWNFHLFAMWREAWNQFTIQSWLNVMLNIALFVPLGILLPLLLPIFRKWHRTVLTGFGISLAIEVMQFATIRGAFDVDDLFTNTLGTAVGWSIVLLVLTIIERKANWKKYCLAYLSIPATIACVFACIFGSYEMQPYGNLPNSPVAKANLKGVQWELEFTPEDSPTTAQVYQVGRLDKDAGNRFGEEFAQKVGTTFEEIDYYNDTIIFSNHSTGDFLNLNQRDGTWEYSIGENTVPEFDASPSNIDAKDVLGVLRGWEIPVPDGVQSSIESSNTGDVGTVTFTAQLVPVQDQLFYGTLSCTLNDKNGTTQMQSIRNNMVALLPYQEKSIVTPIQAIDELYRGNSFSGQMLEEFNGTQIKILSCALDWMADTKGFYQPVYRIVLQLPEQVTITDYVSALN